MKKLICALLALLMLTGTVLAEDFPLELVGQTGIDDYPYVFRTEAAGLPVYFISREEDPGIRMEDVNFDGQDDLVITVIRGASNFGTLFYLWTPEGFEAAETIDMVWNYELLPEKQLLISHRNDGLAGLAFEKVAYRWDGNRLRTVRTARSAGKEDTQFGDSAMMTTTWFDVLEGRVYEGEDTLLMRVLNTGTASEEEGREYWNALNEALMEGL